MARVVNPFDSHGPLRSKSALAVGEPAAGFQSKSNLHCSNENLLQGVSNILFVGSDISFFRFVRSSTPVFFDAIRVESVDYLPGSRRSHGFNLSLLIKGYYL